MPEREQDARLVRFGVFEFDLAAHELRKNGRRVRIREQPFQILRLLLAKPGQVVTREELRGEIWQDDTFVDFDNSLNAAVANLREALGDSASNPRFILTVPRRGYRFIGPVERAARQPLSAPPDFSSSQQSWPKLFAAFRWKTVSLFAGCASIALAGLWLNRSDYPGPETSLTAERVTYYEGVESEADFSPDGNQIVFTWNGEKQDNFDVYVKTIGGPKLLRLTEHPHRDFSPAWSPDGQWIAFLREIGQGRADLYRIPVLGGREERLLEVAAPPPRLGGTWSMHDRYLCWSRDSQFLVVIDRESADEPLSLFLFSPTTGGRRKLTQPPGEGSGDRNPAFSPDGHRLAFNRSQNGKFGVYLVSLRDDLSPAAEPEFLVSQTQPSRGLTWGLVSNELLAHTDGRLRRVSVNGSRTIAPLSLVNARADLPAVSHTANRLVYTQKVFEANIWQFGLSGNRATTRPLKLISSTGSDVNLQYSPDGRQIVFMSNRSGRLNIWISDSDGTQQAPLVRRQGGTPRWAPQGNRIVFDSPSGHGDFDIWTIGSEAGAAQPLTQGSADDRSPNWSRDGKWVYFGSNRGRGYQLWKKELRTGEEVQVTRNGGFYAEESVDGRFVYYTKARNDWSVWRVPAGGGEEVQILEPVSTWNNFAISERGIFYTPQRGPDGRSAILFYDFSNESVTEVFQPDRPISNGISVSSDGKSLLYSQIDREGSDLMLVENFR